jgi:glycosyltransferase involved in cell wall biosynthesis
LKKSYKLAYLVSHPIQYQAPLLRYITSHSSIDLTALFLSDYSVRNYRDPGFGAAVHWDVPLLDGYKHIVLPSIGKRDQVTSLWPLTTHIYRTLKNGGFDALWLHGYAHHANLRAIFAAKLLGIKVLVRAESQTGSASGSQRARRLKEPVIRQLFAKIDAFLSIGTLNAQYYAGYGVPKSKIYSVPYAVDNEFFQTKCREASFSREVLRTSMQLDPGRPIILFASKFQSRKRAIDLLEAYIRLSTDGIAEPFPYLLFIGDGEERTALETRAIEKGWASVKFLGFKNQTELPAYFDLCDVFVLASETEPWGLIVNEVMNAGKAVIVTSQVGAAIDLVQDGVNGFVIAPRDVEALSKRLREVTGDLALARKMGEDGLARINQWGFEQDLSGLQAALDSCVGMAGPR